MEAQKLIILRKQNRLTQAQVAKALSVERSTYCRYEKGERNVDIETLKKLSSFYRIPLSVLVDDEQNSYVADDDRYEDGDTCYLSQLSKEEIALIADYRTLSAEEKKKLKELIKNKQ